MGMKVCDFPPRMRTRVRRFMFYKRDSTQITGREDEVLKQFSPSISREVALYNYKEILHQVPQFKLMPPSFLADIALCLHPHVFGPNEYVYNQNAPADQLYILKSGRVQIERVNPTDGQLNVLDTLHRNSYFGEYNLLYGTKSDVSVRTLEFCDTSSLGKQKLDSILSRFPEMQKLVRHSFLKTLLRKRLMTGELHKLLMDEKFMMEMTEIGKHGKMTAGLKHASHVAHEHVHEHASAHSDAGQAHILMKILANMEKQDAKIDSLQKTVVSLQTTIGAAMGTTLAAVNIET